MRRSDHSCKHSLFFLYVWKNSVSSRKIFIKLCENSDTDTWTPGLLTSAEAAV